MKYPDLPRFRAPRPDLRYGVPVRTATPMSAPARPRTIGGFDRTRVLGHPHSCQRPSGVARKSIKPLLPRRARQSTRSAPTPIPVRSSGQKPGLFSQCLRDPPPPARRCAPRPCAACAVVRPRPIPSSAQPTVAQRSSGSIPRPVWRPARSAASTAGSTSPTQRGTTGAARPRAGIIGR